MPGLKSGPISDAKAKATANAKAKGNGERKGKRRRQKGEGKKASYSSRRTSRGFCPRTRWLATQPVTQVSAAGPANTTVALRPRDIPSIRAPCRPANYFLLSKANGSTVTTLLSRH